MWHPERCDLCGECLEACQYVDYNSEKAIAEMKALMEGKETDILKDCVTCMACNEYCANVKGNAANPFDRIAELHEKTGVQHVPPAIVNFLNGSVMRSELIKGDTDKPVMSICVQEAMLPARALEGQMFDGLTIAKGGKYFCFFAQLHVGKESITRENMPTFVNAVASLGAKEVVFLHDECHAAATKIAPDYGIEVPFKSIHIVEYMLNYLKKHQNDITRINKKIACHRNCSSRYISAEIEPMLDELFELIGVERVARKYDRDKGLCCTFAFAPFMPEKAEEVREMNVIDAEEHGAEAMVFLCPWCWRILAGECEEHGLSPIFITDLCRIALGEKKLF